MENLVAQFSSIVNLIRSIPGGDIAIVISSVIAIASVIVKFTPTTKDNEILDKIIKFVGKYIALNK